MTSRQYKEASAASISELQIDSHRVTHVLPKPLNMKILHLVFRHAYEGREAVSSCRKLRHVDIF